jgi:hypothetical protein
MASLYLTHCTYKKNERLQRTVDKVSPDRLYTGVKITRFINRCKHVGVNWAIFSDLYGVWFPHEKHGYYEKHPNDVTDAEFRDLLQESRDKLLRYDAVYFYGNHKSHYFHRLYKRLIEGLKKEGVNIIKITHIYDIK